RTEWRSATTATSTPRFSEGGAIKAFSPDGSLAREISLAGRNPSNCAFLPDGGLAVTEAERGELVLVETGVKPAGIFRGPPVSA
ncbi:MAG: hypothetical protein J6J65_06585, partial [Opitutales bacterium]|nr:hypothetical protein [Opitutales bacterium]